MNPTPSADVDNLAIEIAGTLGEAAPEARTQIARALERYGAEFVQSLVGEALNIERAGGMPLPDSSRKRTLGGVFFRLLHERTRPAERAAAPPPEGGPAIKWEDRIEAVQAALARPGKARVAKTTVIGRPEDVKPQDDFFVLTISSDENLPSLPRGVPRPPSTVTRFLACIGGRQWLELKPALQDPEDEILATGYAIPNAKQNTVVVFAGKVTTKFLRARSPRRKPGWR
jgi:hypothetical protein